MKPAYQQIAIAHSLAYVIIVLATLALVIVGWRRHRNVAYLVLITWALASLWTILMRAFWTPWVYPTFSKIFGTTVDQTTFMYVTNMLSSLVSGVLLCVGIGLLVFTPPPPRPPAN